MKKAIFVVSVLLVCVILTYFVVRNNSRPPRPFNGDFEECYDAYTALEEKYHSLEYKIEDFFTDIENPVITLSSYFDPDYESSVSFSEAQASFDRLSTFVIDFYKQEKK